MGTYTHYTKSTVQALPFIYRCSKCGEWVITNHITAFQANYQYRYSSNANVLEERDRDMASNFADQCDENAVALSLHCDNHKFVKLKLCAQCSKCGHSEPWANISSPILNILSFFRTWLWIPAVIFTCIGIGDLESGPLTLAAVFAGLFFLGLLGFPLVQFIMQKKLDSVLASYPLESFPLMAPSLPFLFQRIRERKLISDADFHRMGVTDEQLSKDEYLIHYFYSTAETARKNELKKRILHIVLVAAAILFTVCLTRNVLELREKKAASTNQSAVSVQTPSQEDYIFSSESIHLINDAQYRNVSYTDNGKVFFTDQNRLQYEIIAGSLLEYAGSDLAVSFLKGNGIVNGTPRDHSFFTSILKSKFDKYQPKYEYGEFWKGANSSKYFLCSMELEGRPAAFAAVYYEDDFWMILCTGGINTYSSLEKLLKTLDISVTTLTVEQCPMSLLIN